MTLNEFIARLQNLRDSTPEAGNMQVFYRRGASWAMLWKSRRNYANP